MALSSYDKIMLSDVEERQIQDAKDLYVQAQKSGNKVQMEQAHAMAEAIRSRYAYSGGVAGDSFISQAVSNVKRIVTGENAATVTPGGLASPAAYLTDGNGYGVSGSAATISGGAATSGIASDIGSLVTLPDGVFGGSFESATGIGTADTTSDLPAGLKTLILVLGGVVSIGFIASMFKGGKKR